MAIFSRGRPRLIPLALSAAVALTGQIVLAAPAGAAASGAVALPADDAAETVDLTTTANLLHADLTEMQATRDAAEAAYRDARKKALALQKKVARNQEAADQARIVVGQYARTIYISGPTDLSVMASMIDTEVPGEMARLADEALRVGEHKDDQYDIALELLRRNEEMKTAAESATQAAGASLQSIDNQLNGLRREIADGVTAWAQHLAGQSTLFSPEQAKLNSEAAAGWARYLGELANRKIPSVSMAELNKQRLPRGLVQRRNNQGVAVWGRGAEETVVLPERAVAAVTYAVSKLGTSYKWRANSEKAMDCSSLIDRAWNIPAVPRDERTSQRPLIDGGVRTLARNTRLIPTDKLTLGDVVFLSDEGRGVNHAGIVVRPDLMIAADGTTGGVNAIQIPRDRLWHVGRLALDPPSKANAAPGPDKKPFQCGADPSAFVQLPDGKVLSDPGICPPSAVFGEGHMQEAAVRAGRCTAAIWPQIPSIGGWRPSDPYPDHPSGRAIDIMMPEGCSAEASNVAVGNAIATFFMQNASKFDVQYIIWQQRIWTASSGPTPPAQWRGMSNRGGCTANHQDHVHVSLNGPNVNPAPPPPADTAAPKPDAAESAGSGEKSGKSADARKGSASASDTGEVDPSAADRVTGDGGQANGRAPKSAAKPDAASVKKG